MGVTAATRCILDKAQDSGSLNRQDALWLTNLDVDSEDCYALMYAANALTRRVTGGHGTVYSQVGVNVWPCPENCNFCYLGTKHGIVTSPHALTTEQVVGRALDFERGGADEVYLMTTANYPLERLCDTAREVRRALQPHTVLVANVGDLDTAQARMLVDAGFEGIYHVYRFREGIETAIEPERRRRSFRAIRDTGLDLRYCVEPVGPEHTSEEIVEQMFLAREFGATICAVMRRIPVRHTPVEHLGQLTETEIAKLVAVTRLVLGTRIREMGVHEPSLLALRAGAHRICAEVGMNPRDLVADTAKGRGRSVEDCEKLLWEAGFTHPSRSAPTEFAA
jgi:biotin synthase